MGLAVVESYGLQRSSCDGVDVGRNAGLGSRISDSTLRASTPPGLSKLRAFSSYPRAPASSQLHLSSFQSPLSAPSTSCPPCLPSAPPPASSTSRAAWSAARPSAKLPNAACSPPSPTPMHPSRPVSPSSGTAQSAPRPSTSGAFLSFYFPDARCSNKMLCRAIVLHSGVLTQTT